LLDLGSDPDTYTIAVTPLDLVHHSGLGGTFELLQFRGNEHPDVLFVEAAAGMDSLTLDVDLTGLFRNILGDLLVYGRTGDGALALIRSVRKSLTTA
jgi:hypothetical protein